MCVREGALTITVVERAGRTELMELIDEIGAVGVEDGVDVREELI